MAVPFGIGKVIDIINSDKSGKEMKSHLTQFCSILVGIFLVGAVANFGRVYLMKVSGKPGKMFKIKSKLTQYNEHIIL